MKILITGSSGLVGSYCADYLSSLGHAVLSPRFEEFDITNGETVKQYFETTRPEAVLHCAAYTDVTKAESERNDKEGIVWTINVKGTKNLVDICQSQNIYFIHISTDMVFAGGKKDAGPYEETHPTEKNYEALSWYGASKVEAEQCFGVFPESAIVRISNPVRSNYTIKQDFLHKMKSALEQKTSLQLFSDQFLTITYIPDIAKAVERMILNKQKGIFHISSPDITTPFQYASYMANIYHFANNPQITTGSLEEFFKTQSLSNRYVQYGGLRVEHSQQKLGIQCTSWKKTIVDIYAEEKE